MKRSVALQKCKHARDSLVVGVTVGRTLNAHDRRFPPYGLITQDAVVAFIKGWASYCHSSGLRLAYCLVVKAIGTKLQDVVPHTITPIIGSAATELGLQYFTHGQSTFPARVTFGKRDAEE